MTIDPNMTVDDIMVTGVITVRPDSTIDEAFAEMKTVDIRHLMVVDERHRLVGILSDRDLLRAVGAHRQGKHHVSEVMSREIVSVGPKTPARAAAVLLLEHKIGVLPVLDEEVVLVGLVSETDFLRIALRALGGVRP